MEAWHSLVTLVPLMPLESAPKVLLTETAVAEGKASQEQWQEEA